MTRYYIAFPDQNLSEVGEFYALYDEGSSLIIKLRTRDYAIDMEFKDHIFYRKMDEGDAYKYAADLDKQVPLGSVFYKAEMSELLVWLQERSFGAKDPLTLQHYIIAAANDWIDVISWGAPTRKIRALGK